MDASEVAVCGTVHDGPGGDAWPARPSKSGDLAVLFFFFFFFFCSSGLFLLLAFRLEIALVFSGAD